MTATLAIDETDTETEIERLAKERDAALSLCATLLRAAVAVKTSLEGKVAKLQHEVEDLRRQVYGKKSERVAGSQLEDLAAAPAADLPPPPSEAKTEDMAKKPKGKKGHGWGKIPKDVRREPATVLPSEEELVCDLCKGKRVSIGSPEVTERWDYEPRSCFVVETTRPRFRCPRCQDGTVIAPLPPAPLGAGKKRGRAEAGLLALVVVSKFAHHLPLHRQRKILAREGLRLPRSTLGDLVHGTAELLRPVADAVLSEALSRPVVGLDETGLRIVFDKKDKKNGTRAGRAWVYRGLPGEVYFKISATKAKDDEEGPKVVLENYEGKVQADAAGAFDHLYKDGKRVEIGCCCHERRNYHKSKKSHPREAAFALATFKKLYEIEERVRDASPEQRLKARQTETKPILDAFDAWVDKLAASGALEPGSPLAKAVGYSRNHRVALRRFLEDPQLSPDNNAVERALRLVAVGRRNWLFAGSKQGADDAATLYTLVAGCNDLGIDPWRYFRDVIKRRAAGAPPAELTPRAWWAAQKAAEAAAKG